MSDPDYMPGDPRPMGPVPQEPSGVFFAAMHTRTERHMTPTAFLHMILDPGLVLLNSATGIIAQDDRARVLLLAIAGQESGWEARRQVPSMVARSFWQFERSGGVRGVLRHPASAPKIKQVCALLSIPCDEASVYEAIAWSDHLAVAMARLLLYTDAAPLPALGDQDAGWKMYEFSWRPGHPRPEHWAENYQAALAAVQP